MAKKLKFLEQKQPGYKLGGFTPRKKRTVLVRRFKKPLQTYLGELKEFEFNYEDYISKEGKAYYKDKFLEFFNGVMGLVLLIQCFMGILEIFNIVSLPSDYPLYLFMNLFLYAISTNEEGEGEEEKL